jgi:hypothetical protein
MPARIRLEHAPSAPRQTYAVCKELARVLDLPLSDVRAILTRAPLTLPRSLDEAEAATLVERLGSLGATCHLVHPLAELGTSCSQHPRLDGAESCRACNAALCVACASRPTPTGTSLCESCSATAQKKSRRYRMRLVIWFVLLAAVGVYGVRQLRSRRVDWNQPTRVALVLLTPRGQVVAPEAIEGFRRRVPELEARLRTEAAKYLPAPAFPFKLAALGPIEQEADIPRLAGDSFFSLARFNFDVWRFAGTIDRAANIEERDFDVRIYVSARPPADTTRQSVEGASLDGGSIGVVEVELAEDSVDFALFVAAHELFHTRGASDKYGRDGLALRPSGYADPDGVPLYPQRGTEVMARGRPLTPNTEAPPIDLAELTVGPETAREVEWLPSAPQPERFDSDP